MTMTTTIDSTRDGSSERPADLSTSYDELMQTVLWVPPASKSDVDPIEAPEKEASKIIQSGAENCDAEATESARDVKTKRGIDDQVLTSTISNEGNPEKTMSESQTKSPLENLASEPPSFASLERNVFELAEKFRKDVMGEMQSMKDSLSRHHESEIQRLKVEHGRQIASLKHQLSRQRDLNDTYSKTLTRKEETIEHLLQCLATEKEKDRLAKFFVSWREKLRDSDNFLTPEARMAKKFHEAILKRRMWNAWTGIARQSARVKIEAKLKVETKQKLETMEKECDARMLTLQSSLRAARAEIETLRAERESHEERVKAALMRGVCALNVETLSVFSSGGGGGDNSVRSSASVDGSLIASSIHGPSHNGATSTAASTARDPATDGNSGLFSARNGNLLKEIDNQTSTPNESPLSGRLPFKHQMEFNGHGSAPLANSALSNQSSMSYQPKSTARSSYQNSTSRQSCGVNPIGNVPKQKGAQIKTLPHNTIVIERHVDRS